MADDPFEWDVDRVVKELCTTDRTWSPRPNGKLPDPKKLEERLREGEVDGETLLGSLDDASFWGFLNIINPKIKFSVSHAVKAFQRRSPLYQQYAASLRPLDEPPDAGTATPIVVAAVTTNEQQAPNEKFHDQVGLHGQDAENSLNGGSDKDDDKCSNVVPSLQDNRSAQEPPKKKPRRLAAADFTSVDTIARDARFGGPEILTEADMIAVSLPRSLLPNQSDDMHGHLLSKPGAFWGNGFMDLHNFVSFEPTSSNEDRDFGWARPKPFSRVQKHWVNAHMKRYLRNSQPYHGIDDNESILPLLGDSDEEDNPDPVWDNIHCEIREEAEEIELEKAMQSKTELKPEEVDVCLQNMIEEQVARWQEKKLLIEQRKAFTIWNKARREGNRTRRVLDLEVSLQSVTARLNKTLASLKDNTYQNEKELRFLGAHLEPPVYEREKIKWTIDTLKSPDAPPKAVTKAVKPGAKGYVADPVDGGFDIWEDEEVDDHFIVNDDPLDHDDIGSEEATTSQLRDNKCSDDTKAIDASPLLDQPASTLMQSFASVSDVSMYDLTEVHDEDTPVVDLCTPVKPKAPAPQMLNRDSASVEDREGSELSKPDREHLVVELLDSWTTQRRQRILDRIRYTETTEQLWEETFENSLETPQPTNFHDPKAKSRREVVVGLTRLFDLYANGPSPVAADMAHNVGDATPKTVNPWELGAETPKRVRQRKDQCDCFFSLMKKLADDDPDDHLCDSVGLDDAGKPETPSKRKMNHSKRESAAIRRKEQTSTLASEARRINFRRNMETSAQLSKEKTRLIINESKLDEQGLVFVHPHIAPRIQDHQIEGVRFMWDQITGDTLQGCLLAHTMGLGKTMQVITLLTAIREAATSSDKSVSCQIPVHLKVNKTLILCPAGILTNWVEEIKFWAPSDVLGDVFYVESTMSERARVKTVDVWAEKGGVLVIGYSLVRLLRGKNDDMLHKLQNEPTLVVGDEAHAFKNHNTNLGLVTKDFKTRSRIALTGSPLSNNVEEYYSMVDWIAPGFLGLPREFSARYSIPIKNGLWAESSAPDRRKSRVCLAALKKVVAPKVHRRTVAVLKDSLPPKVEFMVNLAIGTFTKTVYQTYVDGTRAQADGAPVATAWALTSVMRLLLAHPSLVHKKLFDTQDNEHRRDLASPSSDDGDQIIQERSVAWPALRDLFNDQQAAESADVSYKMLALEKILEECMKLEENVLVFSQSIPTLDFIEAKLCRARHRAYMRIDGSVLPARRQNIVKSFNSRTAQVFLISTTAGGVGLNIPSANRVVVMDFKYNPVHEQQAIGRAYRIGQNKPVFVYWLICEGTFETKMLNQQVFKNQLFLRVVDSKHPDNRASKSYMEWFKPYEEPEWHDTSKYRGKDAVLDALLDSEVSKGIASIVTTDTFEEEEADKELDANGQLEADQMVSQRMMGTEGATHPQQPASQVRQLPIITPQTFSSAYPGPVAMALDAQSGLVGLQETLNVAVSAEIPVQGPAPANLQLMLCSAGPPVIETPQGALTDRTQQVQTQAAVSTSTPAGYAVGVGSARPSIFMPSYNLGYVPRGGFQFAANPLPASSASNSALTGPNAIADSNGPNDEQAGASTRVQSLDPVSLGNPESRATATKSNAASNNGGHSKVTKSEALTDTPQKEALMSACARGTNSGAVDRRWPSACKQMENALPGVLPRRQAWTRLSQAVNAYPAVANAVLDGHAAGLMQDIMNLSNEEIREALLNRRQSSSVPPTTTKKVGKGDPNVRAPSNCRARSN